MSIISPIKITAQELARVSPLGWMSYASSGFWTPYPWLEIVDHYFRRCMDKSDPLKRVALSAPPQHGKSEYSCVAAPSFAVGKYPDERGILVLHSGGLAEEFGRRCRNLVDDHGKEIWDIQLDPSTKSKKRWRVKGRRGGLESVGLSVGISGRSADWAIFDDPFPNYQKAASLTYREQVWQFYLNDLRTRLSKDAWMILLQTRWNDDDLIGRIEKGMSGDRDMWEIVNLPAIAMTDEYHPDGRLFRKEGEALCPELKPLEFLEEQKTTMDPGMYAGLYQQIGLRPEGTRWGAEHFNQDIWVDQWPKDIKWAVAFLDPALGKDAKGDDYQALTYVGVRGGRDQNQLMPNDVFYVGADIFRETIDEMLERSVSYIQHIAPRPPIYFNVEAVAFQKYLTTPLRAILYREGLHRDIYVSGLPVDTTVPKDMRITMALSSLILHKKLRFVRGKGTSLLVDQLKNFGSSAVKKDGPDSLAGAFHTFDNLAILLSRSRKG